MVRRGLLLLVLVIMISDAYALSCVNDVLDKAGICVNELYSTLSGKQYYKSCNYEYTYDSGKPWTGYVQCYGAVSSGAILSDDGTIVAEAWSANSVKLDACAGRDGYMCDVFTPDGFDSVHTNNDRGFCDSSQANCVKCNADKTEHLVWTGGAYFKTAGNGLCESGCGAYLYCDELPKGAYTGQCYGVREAYCGNSCEAVPGTCEAGCGAQAETDEKGTGDVCVTDYCLNRRLYDYNGNGALDSTYVLSDCTCDAVIDESYCDVSNCGADVQCDNHLPGHHISNSGCNDYCSWINCGLYAWNTTSCHSQCSIDSSHCYGSAVCNYYSNECVIDSTPPVVSITSPLQLHNYSYSPTVSYTPTDSVDNTLDCYYFLDSLNPVSRGVINSGITDSFTLPSPSEDWHDIYVKCYDEAGNEGQSVTRRFLYDVTPPSYSAINTKDLTPTPDNTLIDGDLVEFSVRWSDNFYLRNATLETDKTGVFTTERVWIFSGASNIEWTNYTFDTKGFNGTNIQWRVRAIDSAGNSMVTPLQSFFVIEPTADIKVNYHETGGSFNNRFEFELNASESSNVTPIDYVVNELIGVFEVEHQGVGTSINLFMSLNEILMSGVTMKVSNSSNPSSAVTLSGAEQLMPFCQGMIPDEVCQVWVWVDHSYGINPQSMNGGILITSRAL